MPWFSIVPSLIVHSWPSSAARVIMRYVTTFLSTLQSSEHAGAMIAV